MDILKSLRRPTYVAAGLLAREPSPAVAPSDRNSVSHAADGNIDTKGRWIGFVDGVDRSVITGWGYDARTPARSVPIEMVASDGKCLTALAVRYRQDVRDAGHGTGYYGFEVDVSDLGLRDEMLVVRFAESKVTIATLPFSLNPQRAVLEGALPAAYATVMQRLVIDARAKLKLLEDQGMPHLST